jgi:hypothetical protein
MQPTFRQVPPKVERPSTQDAHAQLAGADGCVVAARATADDHHVIGFHGFNSRDEERERGIRLV